MGERVASLETHVEQLLEDGLRREQKQTEAHEAFLAKLTGLEDKFDTAQLELARYKGFGGAILLMLSAMGTALGLLFKPWLLPLWNALVKLKTGGG